MFRFAGPNGEIDWFHSIEHEPEYDAYTHEQSRSGDDTLLFGHTTYDMMKTFWPTPEADKTHPEMAKVMRNSPKVVVTKKLKSVGDEPSGDRGQTFVSKADRQSVAGFRFSGG